MSVCKSMIFSSEVTTHSSMGLRYDKDYLPVYLIVLVSQNGV